MLFNIFLRESTHIPRGFPRGIRTYPILVPDDLCVLGEDKEKEREGEGEKGPSEAERMRETSPPCLRIV